MTLSLPLYESDAQHGWLRVNVHVLHAR
jgi:hypothetical protein